MTSDMVTLGGLSMVLFGYEVSPIDSYDKIRRILVGNAIVEHPGDFRRQKSSSRKVTRA